MSLIENLNDFNFMKVPKQKALIVINIHCIFDELCTELRIQNTYVSNTLHIPAG